MANIIYPRFISNKPCGVDKFVGKSQERLTNAIAEHIKEVDSDNELKKTRIIGLEGSWGSGKSNIIEQLKKKYDDIKDPYYIFIYDAWGHQEDLQRRSFLEKLTTELIEKSILIGDTTIETKEGEKKNVTWVEKKNYLLARKTAIETDARPKLNTAFVVIFLAIISTIILSHIAEIIKYSYRYWWISIILVLISPIAAALYLLYKNGIKKNSIKNIFNEIVSIYSGKVRNEVEYRTISEKEPSVVDFRKWMKDISKSIWDDKKNEENKKKLIVVYDNMDRLPAEKVKELWASIHTFFSEDGFDNIWAIIPFDKKHLSCAFGETEEKDKLTNLFISKTFPVVYRVTPPVISDYKEIFNSFFEEAFGDTQQEYKDEINRIFRLENPNATVRDIIEYINQLVALKKVWKDEIDLLYIAIFKLKESVILNGDPANNILGGEYLGTYLSKIISNDENLQKNISALVYGVDIENAEQIPMSKYINSCFNSVNKNNINRYANSKNFILILKDKVKNSDNAQLDNIIQSLSDLDVSKLPESEQKEITSFWNILAEKKMKLTLRKQEFDSNDERLLRYAECKQDIIKYLCRQIQSSEKFNGRDYFNSLKKLDKFVADNSINIDISKNLKRLEQDPQTFVDYVLCAQTEYLNYKLSANPTELSEYLSARVVDKYSELDVLQYLKDDENYKFDEVKTKIETTIQDQNLIRENNFKPILDAYKILSDERPLNVQLSPTQRQTIWNALRSKTDTREHLEIVAIQIANGANIADTYNAEQIKYIAEQMDYYANYGDLLTNNNWSFPVLNNVLKYMTENKMGVNLSLKDVLPQFFDIKNRIGVSESTLLSQLNNYWEEQKDTITSENIKQILPDKNFFQFSVKEKNNLTDYLNTEIVKSLVNEQSDVLSQQVKQPNTYWHTVIENIIDTEFLERLPDNLSDLGIQYLDNIAASRSSIPTREDIIYKIIKKLDSKNTSAHIKDVIDEYCNGTYVINPNTFLFF